MEEEEEEEGGGIVADACLVFFSLGSSKTMGGDDILLASLPSSFPFCSSSIIAETVPPPPQMRRQRRCQASWRFISLQNSYCNLVPRWRKWHKTAQNGSKDRARRRKTAQNGQNGARQRSIRDKFPRGTKLWGGGKSLAPFLKQSLSKIGGPRPPFPPENIFSGFFPAGDLARISDKENSVQCT